MRLRVCSALPKILEIYDSDITSVFVSLIDNEENHDLLAEVARLRDEKSQLVKEIQELKEGQRETVGAKFQDLQAQAAKKAGMLLESFFRLIYTEVLTAYLTGKPMELQNILKATRK